MLVGTTAHKDEEVFNPVGDTEPQYVLVKVGGLLRIVYRHGNMTQLLRDDAAAAKVLSR